MSEVLSEGGDVKDGRMIMSKIFNRSYHSVQGFDVSVSVLNRQGDGRLNFNLVYQTQITKQLICLSFSFFFVFRQVYIDSNGDAEGNFTVIALQDDLSIQSNKTTLKMSMQPVGYFVYNTPGDIPVN